MKIFNTLTGKKEDFETIKEKELSMYVCGPTVYNYIHIGNARPVVFFDVVRRYFEYIGYKVNYVSNITDVDDKIILEAERLKIDEKTLTKVFIDAYIRDTGNLGSLLPTMMPKATDYVSNMIKYIEDLIKTGYAYHSGDAVYFRVNKIDDYGKLSNQVLEDLNVGARIEENYEKESPFDFVVWKSTELGMRFDSPWGEGRPGWHTECATMNQEIFKEEIDIHGGGSDLKFPHHENEIAQSEAIHHHPIAKTWMHVGRLGINNVDMSKSLGNIIWVKDLLKDYEYQAFRLMLLSHHYRQPINYSTDLMNQFNHEWQRIKRALKGVFVDMSIEHYDMVEFNNDSLDRFKEQMEDDFNIANALTVVYEEIKTMNRANELSAKARSYYTIIQMLSVLGISVEQKRLTEEDIRNYQDWQIARSEKRFNDADQIRIRLVEAGIL
ncbi:MAG: cysteine--tRNA ligase [Acholeplasmataceae bacterium]|nr:cysteine--tRNA ligase [Acholeplasmataceae bacterium]